MLFTGAQMRGRGHGRVRDHRPGEEIALDGVRRGDEVEIIEVADDHARLHALRFGVCQGSCVRCVTRIPAGPVVIESGRQEIAIGRGLAKRIRVRQVGAADIRRARLQ
ncbi:MAG: ferrous iron transport protein A [Actinomycetota bacterium]|nr:ferrous iron transport protein A [Actinomycetota bacterium]